MRILSLFFLIGTLQIQLLKSLPSLLFLQLFAFVLILGLTFVFKLYPRLFTLLSIIFSGFFLGLLFSTLLAKQMIDTQLSPEYEGKDIILKGLVKDLPDNRADGIRFKLEIFQSYLLDEPKKPLKIKGIVRLGWYQQVQQIHAGEKWQLRVRLKRPAGFMNPGGFDYEKWLFTQRIIATGYIRKGEDNKRLASASRWSINSLREKIHTAIQTNLEDSPSAAVLSALMVADRSDLDDSQWEVFQHTGTSHLIAISGLHIAIIAGFGFFPIMLIWWLFPRLNEIVPVKIAGSFTSALFAVSYALLAGFSLPTQRALLMVLIVLMGLLGRKMYSASLILSVALLAVLLFDPLSAMTVSFWLSFFAVSLILIILKRQLKVSARFHFFALQLLLSLGMFPLTLLFFGSSSLSAPIANLFAIPWVSLLIVPTGLLAVVLMPFSDLLSQALFEFSANMITLLLNGLDFLSALPLSSIMIASLPNTYLFLAIVGFLYLLFPRGFPARWLGLILVLPALLFTNKKPDYGSFDLTLLDVGQGMASVVQTASHTVIYDTGTRISDSFDMGKLVIVPFLNSKGIDKIDQMILSHNNLDHRGGAKTVLAKIAVDSVLSSDINILDEQTIKLCRAGQTWTYDGVKFEIISPRKDSSMRDNNASCVLRVSNKNHSLLLTGDIQKKAEKIISKMDSERLASEVISVPHHGSKTSSTVHFLKTVSPELALIPVGYRNRFGHPKKEIVNRYQTLGIKLMDTVNAGAISIDFPASQAGITVVGYRNEFSNFWNRDSKIKNKKN